MRFLILVLSMLVLIAACSNEPSTISDDIAITDESDYLVDMTSMTDDTISVIEGVLVLVGNPEFGDSSNWLDKLLYQQNRLQRVQTQALSIQPPSEYRETHSYFLQGIDHLVIALDYIESGYSNMDIDDLDKAIEHMDRCTSLISQARDALP